MICSSLLLLLPLAAPARGQEGAVPSAYYHFSVGLQARFSGDMDGALEEYRPALALDPTATEVRIEIAKILRETGHAPEALSSAREAVKGDREDAAAHRLLAQLLQSGAAGTSAEGGLKEAAAEYEETLRLEPTDGGALVTLAALYQQVGDAQGAIHAWERYLELDPGSFDGHMQLATLLLGQGETERASAVLKAAVDLQPEAARAYQSLGDVYAQADHLDQAIVHYRKALEIEPGDLRTRLVLGEVLLRAKRPEEALAEVRAIQGVDPKSRFALDLLARASRDLRRFDEADLAADRLLAETPGDVKATYLKLTIAEARRDFAAVARLAEEVLARRRTGEDPTESKSHDRVFLVHLGFAYQELDRYADAAAAFARAREAAGGTDEELSGYEIEALIRAKDLGTALQRVQAAHARTPTSATLVGLEARIRRERGDEAGAVALIEQLRTWSPPKPGNYTVLADFYRKLGRLQDAEGALRVARQLDPKSVGVLFQLGAVLERQRRQEEADEIFREALAISPDSAAVLNYLGYMNADRGVRVAEALSFVERAVALDPGNGAYLDSLGWTEYRLGRVEDAERSIRRALEREPKNAVILDHLGDVLERRGRLAEAIDVWRQALTGEDDDEELDRARVTHKIGEAQAALQPPEPRQ